MTNSASLPHLGIVASLVLCVAVSGSASCFSGGFVCGPEARASSPHRACCCCGTSCNSKCGMACCRPTAPTQDRPATPVKLTDEFGPTWALVATAPITAGDRTAQHGSSSAGGSLVSALSSLLALSIRLNV